MSYSLKYYPDPGIAFDIVRMLFVKLNPPSVWQELLTSPESVHEESEYLQRYANMLPNPPADLLLFTFLPSNKNETFLSNLIRTSICRDYNDFSFKNLISTLTNVSYIRTALYSYYLALPSSEYNEIEYAIRSNKYIPDRIKILLFSFILNTEKYIELLINTLQSYYSQISTLCVPESPTKYISDSFLSKIYTPDIFYAHKEDIPISFSICYTTTDFLLRNSSLSSLFFITAIPTIQNITFSDTAPQDVLSLQVYIDALKDKHRISIIQQLRRNRSLSLNELSELIGLSNSATNYHLLILRKANMISCIRNNRIYQYSYNPIGFEIIYTILHQIEKGGVQ